MSKLSLNLTKISKKNQTKLSVDLSESPWWIHMTLFVLHLKCNHVILGLVGHHWYSRLAIPSYMATGRSPLETCQDSWQPSPGLHATHRTLSAAHGILFQQQQQPSRQAAEIIQKIGSEVRMKIFVFKSEKN